MWTEWNWIPLSYLYHVMQLFRFFSCWAVWFKVSSDVEPSHGRYFYNVFQKLWCFKNQCFCSPHHGMITLSWCSVLSAHKMIIFSLQTWIMAAGVLSSAGSCKASRFQHHNPASVTQPDSLIERFLVESRLSPLSSFPLSVLFFSTTVAVREIECV